MKIVSRLLDTITFGLYSVGLATVGAFFTNTRTVGIRDSPVKEPLIAVSVIIWPLIGLLDFLSVRSRFFASLFGQKTPRRVCRWLLIVLGTRYLVHQYRANKTPLKITSGVLVKSVEVTGIHEEIARAEGIDTSTTRGKLFRLNERYLLEVVTYEVTLSNLPPEFDGYKIAQITDIHTGSFISPLFPRYCVRTVLSLEPDIIALTGDYQHHREDIKKAGRLLSPIGEWSMERGGKAALAVLGNHDTWPGTAAVTHTLSSMGIYVLHNRNVKIERGDASIYIAGVADLWSLNADLDLALHDIPEGACSVLLSHVPDIFQQAATRGVALQLSGHLHGGQIKLPFVGALLSPSRFNRRYVEGFYRSGGSLMYVCRGIGGHPSIRYGAKPEVSVFILRSGTVTST